MARLARVVAPGYPHHVTQRTGRPLGSPAFVANLEGQLDRSLQKGKPGPKNKIK